MSYSAKSALHCLPKQHSAQSAGVVIATTRTSIRGFAKGVNSFALHVCGLWLFFIDSALSPQAAVAAAEQFSNNFKQRLRNFCCENFAIYHGPTGSSINDNDGQKSPGQHDDHRHQQLRPRAFGGGKVSRKKEYFAISSAAADLAITGNRGQNWGRNAINSKNDLWELSHHYHAVTKTDQGRCWHAR